MVGYNSNNGEDNNKEKIFKNRINSLSFLVLLLFGVIFFRLYTLQVKSYDYYKDLADKQHFLHLTLNPKRGGIYLNEESGLVSVATNKDMFNVYAIPDNINKEDAEILSYKISEILGMEKEIIHSKLSKTNNVYERLKKRVSEEEVSRIKNLNHKGIKIEEESSRYYPNNSLAAQIVGFEGFKGEGKTGLYGIEKQYNNILLGKSGWLRQEKDAGSRWISIGERLINPAQNGSDIILSIDYPVQFKAELTLKNAVRKHRADGGRIIIMDPHNGDIIAMAQEPSFDLNQYSKVEDLSIYMNSNLSFVYECGSIFKTFTMAAGLNEGVIKPEDNYIDTGSINISGYTIKNSEEKIYGKSTMSEIIENSINTGVIYIEKKLGNSKFLEYVEKFGFGRETGINLPGELKGNISNLKTNRDIEYYTASFGQGITVTPIQVATAYSAIANGGEMVKPRIVKTIIDQNGQRNEIKEEKKEKIISQSIANQTALMLGNNVVNGHGKPASVPGYKVAGKTGTAQISDKEKGGYLEGATIGSFAGFAPLDNPRFVILVIIDDPKDVKWAESTAGPVFGEMAKFMFEHYGIKPTEDYSKEELERFKISHDYLNHISNEDKEKRLEERNEIN